MHLFIKQIKDFKKSKFNKSGFSYNISTITMGRVDAPEETFYHYLHSEDRRGGPETQLMQALDTILIDLSQKVRTDEDKIILKNMGWHKYQIPGTFSKRNCVLPTPTTEIYLVGKWGHIKVDINKAVTEL